MAMVWLYMYAFRRGVYYTDFSSLWCKNSQMRVIYHYPLVLNKHTCLKLSHLYTCIRGWFVLAILNSSSCPLVKTYLLVLQDKGKTEDQKETKNSSEKICDGGEIPHFTGCKRSPWKQQHVWCVFWRDGVWECKQVFTRVRVC